MVHKWTVHVFSPGCVKVIHPDQSSKDNNKDKEAKDGKKDEDVMEDKKDRDIKEDVKDEDNKEGKKDEDKKEDKIVEVEKEEKTDTDDKRVEDDEDLEPRVVNPKTDEQRCRLQEACRDVLLFTTLDQVSNGQIPQTKAAFLIAL